jgi:hypothetical protein
MMMILGLPTTTIEIRVYLEEIVWNIIPSGLYKENPHVSVSSC